MDIRQQVLRGIALNRTPGFHFAGNFLGIDLAEVGTSTRVVMDSGHEVEPATLFMVADIALAASIRSQLAPNTRLATVSMQLQLNGEPVAGRIEARGDFAGFAAGGAARQGLARVTLTAQGRHVGSGHGAFMALDPPPGMTLFPVQPARRDEVELPPEASLDASERNILARAERALAGGEGSFISRFFGIVPAATQDGAACRMENGAHVGNRVGHAQGGVLMGLAAATANTALGAHWTLASIAASFVGPGEGEALEAVASLVHRGRWTAVARTQVSVPGARRVLEVTTNHSRRE